MVKRVSVVLFSLIAVFTVLLMTLTAAEMYKSEITINVGAFYKVYVSILRDTEEFSKITSFNYEYPNHDNLLMKNVSVNESSIKIGIAVKDASDNTLLNSKYGPFDTGKPILVDLRDALGIDKTVTNITPDSSITNITNTTAQNNTSNETLTENTTPESEKSITGWMISIFKTPDNKIKLVYPIVLGIFIAFTVFIMIFRRYNKYKKAQAKDEEKEDDKKDSGYEGDDGEKLRVKKYSELISEREISSAETKLQEAQQEIEKIKTKQQKIREAREKFEKAKQEWEHTRDEMETA